MMNTTYLKAGQRSYLMRHNGSGWARIEWDLGACKLECEVKRYHWGDRDVQYMVWIRHPNTRGFIPVEVTRETARYMLRKVAEGNNHA